MPTPARAREDFWVRILVLLLSAAALAPIWAAPYPPLQDFPNHLLKTDLLRRWLAGESWDDSIYALQIKVLPNLTLYAALLFFSLVCSLIGSAKIFLSLAVVALPLSTYFFLRRVNPENTLFAPAAALLNFSLFLMMGSMNFCMALALFPLALAFFMAEPRPGVRGWLPFAALSTLLYLTHGFVFLALLGCVLCLLGLHGGAGRLPRALGLLPGVACFALNLTESFKRTAPPSGSVHPFFATPGWHTVTTGLAWILAPHGWGPDTPFALAWLLVLGACAALLVVQALRAWRAGERWDQIFRRHGWLVIAGLLLLAFFFAPVQVGEWSHARPRFVPVAVLTLLGGLQLRGRLVRLLALAIFVLAALAGDVRNTREFMRGSERVSEYLEGLSSVEEGAAILPVEAPHKGARYSPTLHAWGYYALAKKAWSPYMHGEVTHNPVIYKVSPWGPGEETGLRKPDLLPRIAACYDYLLQWNALEGDAALLRPYFSIVKATAHLKVWRNRAGVRHSIPATNPACASPAPPPS